ncbi:Putative cytosolic 5'-nucleotidase 3 [Toxocara canis]|uniref:5'-nucleotidase n=1 Tax=Toxocara canis TaxID=6265 RepID=A0A0B2VKC7_TOXCA|nr:Putative cytosolic 5'-nucleotidase 3 [Toxocara canis]
MITHRLLKRLARKSDYRWCGDLRMDFIKNHSSVRMRDPSEVRRKLDKFICDQPEHLLVIADFDHTLSRTKNHLGEECCISYGVFEMEAMRISPEYGEYFTKLAEKYLPIELSTTMTREEKAPYMVEWWVYSVFCGASLNRSLTDAQIALEAMSNLIHVENFEKLSSL